MARQVEIKKIAMIGRGNMGGAMALLFAEKGITVSLNDPSELNVRQILEHAEQAGIRDKMEKYGNYKDLCKSLDSQARVFVFSMPHGSVGDGVIEGLREYLDKGDIILDAANEHWRNTEKGVFYIGIGVSGGYQSARRGPSMCKGGEDNALDIFMLLLKRVPVKDARGISCVAKIGLGGSGHYVKIIRNGIEYAMLSVLAEAWQIMNKCL